MATTRKIFMTGATGLVGRGLLARLGGDKRSGGRDMPAVVALSRNVSAFPEPGVRFVMGRLSEPQTWAGSLEGVTEFVHMAALTGKASAAEYERVNVEATRIAIEQCKLAGVRRFLFVSTIAVNYPDIARYPYAQSKVRAETLVRASGLEWTIVRPTIVLGRRAKQWHKFEGLAGLPLVPMFGDGKIRIQPIHVDDLGACLASWFDDPSLAGETLELGGPEVIEFGAMLSRIHRRKKGTDARFLRIPLKLSMSVAWALEGPLLPVLPVTAGQLHAFRYDSTAQPNRLFERHAQAMKNVDAMLDDLMKYA
jgi:NADH dehydrogenase